MPKRKSLGFGLLFSIAFPGVINAQQTLQFTVRFADPAGYNDITRATVTMGSERCQVEIYPATREFDVFDGRGFARTAMARLASGAVRANSTCSIASSGTSVKGSGEQLAIAVRASFPSLLGANRPFTAYALTASGMSLAPVFTWIDPSPTPVSGELLPSVAAQTTSGNCQYSFPDWESSFPGGPSSVLFLWTAQPGCLGSVVSSSSSITVGTPGTVGVFNYVPISLGPNTVNTYAKGTLTFTGTGFSQVFDVSQGSGIVSVSSVSPQFGSGTSQLFTIQAIEEGFGFSVLDEITLEFAGADNATCQVHVTPNYTADSPNAATVALMQDDGSYSGAIPLPSTETLQNAECSLNAALSSVSFSGENMTIQLALGFTQGLGGARYFTVNSPAGLEVYGIWSVPIDPTQPALRIAKSHAGNFTQAQPNSYTITISNLAGAAPSSGTVTVTDTLPQGLTLGQMAGIGWNCTANACSRSDSLSGGDSYPPITVSVNVGAAFAGGTNVATVSGGASITLSASDYTNYIANFPMLSVTSSHTGNFNQGQLNATYTIVVSNQAGAAPTSGTVEVSDMVPNGMTLVSIAGSGWTNCLGSYWCSRSDTLNGGSTYPPIVMTVDVSPTAVSPVTNSVQAFGGGSPTASYADPTTIVPYGAVVTIQANIPGSPFSLEDGTVYQAPTTFYWPSGAQHTVTWLTSSPTLPGAMYTFQSWADGGSNPRTFTATATVTYTAMLDAQLLLTVNIPFSGGSTVTVNPPSANGYYPYGTVVTLTANAAPGAFANGFSGTLNGGSPLSITMTAPYTETANFQCNDYPDGLTNSALFPAGPIFGILYWPDNLACPQTVTGTTPWFTFGTPAVFAGYNVLPYSVTENTTPSIRTASISVSGTPYSVNQDGEPEVYGESNIVSIAPNTGSGASQVFTFEVYNPAGYGQINAILQFTGTYCTIFISPNGGVPGISMYSDTEQLQQLVLPGAGSISNSSCSIAAANSSVTASGNSATVQLNITFTPADAGTFSIVDGVNYIILGLWNVPATPSAPALSIIGSIDYFSGGINPGQTNVGLYLTVRNAPGAGPTSGAVTFTATLPSGLSLGSTGGTGWNCTGTTCTRSDSLSAGASYPAIELTVNVLTNATGTQVVDLGVSGGGSPPFDAPDVVAVNGPPSLQVQGSHTGSFVAGQSNVSYTIKVSNQPGSQPTTGTVTVTENLPSGLTLVSMEGSEWNCSGNTCSLSGSLAGGQFAQNITATVNVGQGATSPQVNQVTVSGGGSASATASDSTVIIVNPPILNVSVTDNGPFYQYESGAVYTVVVSDQAGAPATTGTVTVTELSGGNGPGILSMSGNGWACNSSSLVCTRSDSLAGGASYPPIAVTVSVAYITPVVNRVSAAAVGAETAIGADSTVVLPTATLTATLTDNGPFTQAETNATYSLTVSNKAGGAPLQGGVMVTESLGFETTAVSLAGVGWTCNLGNTCNRTDSLAAGASYPPLTVKANIPGDAPSSLTNVITVDSNNGGYVTTLTDTTTVLPQAPGSQYPFSVAISPPGAGTVTVSPSSPNGLYTNGQSVTITAAANPGFTFGFYNLGFFTASGVSTNPFTYTFNSPISAVAQFNCAYTFYGPGLETQGPGPLSELLLYTAGPGCTLSATSATSGLTTGAAYASDGFTAIPFTLAANNGAQLQLSYGISGTTYGPQTGTFSRGAAGSTPGVVSVSPNHGAGSGQVFTLQAYDAAGYANMGEVDLAVIGTDGSECRAAMSSLGGQGELYLVGDGGTFLGPLNLPGAGTLQNSLCTLSATGSSVSGSGSFVTANFNLTFSQAFAGSKYVTGATLDSTGVSGGTNVLGTWQVTPAPEGPVLTAPSNAASGTPLAPSLIWISAAGASSFDVYFGTSANPPYLATTSIASYPAPALNPGSTYYWQVVAKNSAGSNASPIWSFTTAQACSAPVTAASPYSMPASGGSATVTVAASSACSWGYSTPVPWVTFQPLSGLSSGAGSLTFTVAPNDSPSPRSSSVTVAGVTFAIAQAANLVCDVTGDPQPTVGDIQEMIDEALGTAMPLHAFSANQTVTVADIQIVINAVMGNGCTATGN